MDGYACTCTDMCAYEQDISNITYRLSCLSTLMVSLAGDRDTPAEDILTLHVTLSVELELV